MAAPADLGIRDAEHDVDRPAQVAPQKLAAQRGRLEPVGVGAHRVVVRKVATQHVGDATQVSVAERRIDAISTGERELEVELAQPVGDGDVDEPESVGQGAQ